MPIGPQQLENDPKNEGKSIVSIEGNLEKKSLNYKLDPKTVLNHTLTPKIANLGQKNKKKQKTKSTKK